MFSFFVLIQIIRCYFSLDFERIILRTITKIRLSGRLRLANHIKTHD